MTCWPMALLLAELCARLSRRLNHLGFGRLPTQGQGIESRGSVLAQNLAAGGESRRWTSSFTD
jgi:hypothetical protein